MVYTRIWGGAEALARLQAHNTAVRRIRGCIEKVFGTTKRSYGLRRMRWVGLAKAGLQVRLAAFDVTAHRLPIEAALPGDLRDRQALRIHSVSTAEKSGF